MTITTALAPQAKVVAGKPMEEKRKKQKTKMVCFFLFCFCFVLFPNLCVFLYKVCVYCFCCFLCFVFVFFVGHHAGRCTEKKKK